MRVLEDFERLLKQLADIRVNRIEHVLIELSHTKMLALPGPDEPTPEIFDLVRLTKSQITTAAEGMNALTTTVLKATVELLNLILEDYDRYVDENNLASAIVEEVQIRYAHMESQDPSGGEWNIDDVYARAIHETIA